MINKLDSIKFQDKAHTLIEALPYIQRFHNKIIVIKYGGSAMLDELLKENVMRDVALLKAVGMHPVIVHGGGKEITKWVELNGMKSTFHNGFRITDSETMKIVEMVLGGVNKGLVSHMESLGVKAVGLSGKDGSMLRVRKKVLDDVDLGFVGDITKVNIKLINTLLKDDYVPVICPIGLDKDYSMYNINADEAASEIAIALEAEKLAYLTDTEGFYMDYNNKNSLISRITVNETQNLIREGKIDGGMLPKMQNCIKAVKNGVQRVHILDGRQMHSLLLEIFTKEGIGTLIYR